MGARRIYYFGPFSLDPAERRLTRDGKAIGLTPKTFDLLVVLVENGGHLIKKETLLERVWPSQFVEESNLSFNISALRKALGEGLHGQRYIETVPKKGFRFLPRVEQHWCTEMELGGENQNGALPTEDIKESGQGLTNHAIGAESNVFAAPAAQSYRSQTLKTLFIVLIAGVALLLTYGLWTRQASTSHQQPLRTIAVLPFKPLSVDSRDESLEMGMAAAIITRLSGIKEIMVRQISAVRKYTDPSQDIVKAGQELQAEAVLDGSIQKAGDRVRVTVRLTNVQTGVLIWTEQFDENFSDIFKVQDSIAERVTQALALKLSGEERQQLTKHHTDNLDAYVLYLQGQYLWSKQSGDRVDNFRKSLSFHQKAVEKDPEFAPAYVGISEFYISAGNPKLPPLERLQKAKAAVLRALEIDNTLPEAYTALAEIKYQYEFDWFGAEEDFKRSIQLKPHVSYTHLAYGWFLMCNERFEEAQAEMAKGQELDPGSFALNKTRGILLLFTDQHDEAIKHYQKMREMEPTGIHRNQFTMSVAYERKGMYAEAVEEFLEDGRTREYLSPREIKALGEVFRGSGWDAFIRMRINLLEEKSKTQHIEPTTLAGIYALAGQKDLAFAWLDKAIETHDAWISLIKIQPAYDSLRSDPRYLKLLQRVNLMPKATS